MTYTEEEKQKTKEDFERMKSMEASALRPTALSAAKTADVRLKRIYEEVCGRLHHKPTRTDQF